MLHSFSVQRVEAVDCAKISPNESTGEPSYRIGFKLERGGKDTRDIDVNVSAEQLPILLHDMEQVVALMDSLESS